MIFGKLEKSSLQGLTDLSWREMAILAPLVVMTIWYGVQPQAVLDACSGSVAELIKGYDTALAVTKTAVQFAANAH